MYVSRRDLLRAVMVGALAIGMPGAFAGQAAGLAAAPTRLRRREFRPQIGTTFLLGPAGVAAKLVAVSDQSKRTAGDDARFSLLFEIPATPPEGIYAMRHAALRTFDLFLAPVGRTAGVYEAVVNS